MAYRRISRGLVVLVVLLGASLAAWAGPAPTVTISSPSPETPILADSQEITATVSAADGAQVAYLELYVDGSLHTAKRLLPPVESGRVTLSWATSQFLNGEHAVSVRVHDTAGQSAETSVSLRLERPGGPRLTLPVITIASPRDGATVSGKTHVTMRARAAGGIKYVMLFIDEVFTCFTNMPPYEYAWNTLRSENGEHVLQAKAFDTAEREGVSEKIAVRVNNPGGRTTMEPQPAAPEPKQEPAPPPAEETVPAAPSLSVADPAAQAVTVVALPASGEAISKIGLQAPRAQPKQQEAVRIARLPGLLEEEPQAEPPGEPSPPAAAPRPATATTAEPVMIAQAPAMGRARGAATPVSTAKPVVVAKAPTVVRQVVAIEQGPAGVVLHTVRPGQELGRVARIYGVSAETLADANGLAAERVLAAGETLRVPIAKGRLYINGRPLVSDVPTMFVNGIAAGPFRHIVERSGGTVIWSPADRSIAASGFGKSIQLWVGKAEAEVDGCAVSLDLATFIDGGRAMVPLRFFRDALDYAVTYDEDTGRIYVARR